MLLDMTGRKETSSVNTGDGGRGNDNTLRGSFQLASVYACLIRLCAGVLAYHHRRRHCSLERAATFRKTGGDGYCLRMTIMGKFGRNAMDL